jgi:transposase
VLWTGSFFEHFGLYDVIKGMKSKGTDLGKLAELMVAYKVGDNFSILRCHDLAMSPLVKEHFRFPEFDVRGLYRAVEILGANRETVITHFRKTFLSMYGPEITDMIFDWTSLVYFGSEPDLAMRGYSRDGRPEECQVTVGVAQLAKPLCVPVGLTIMPGNTNDKKHMRSTYDQVKDDMSRDSMLIFDGGAAGKGMLDRIIEDGNHFITIKRLNKSDDKIFERFSEDTWECIDEEKGEYCLKKKFPSRVNYYFYSRERYELNMKRTGKKIRKDLKEARDLENGKIPKEFTFGNPLIDGKMVRQSRLSELGEEEAMSILERKHTTGREGFFCITSDKDMDPHEARSSYRSKDIVEKLFSSMKSDIGIRPIRAWTENGVYGVLLIGFLAQAMVSVTRFLAKPASSRATKFITNSMQNLTLTAEIGGDGRRRRILSNFDPLNTSILRSFGVISEVSCP